MSERCCATCRWWVKSSHALWAEPGRGECHGGPPISREVAGQFPLSYGDDWCRQHEPWPKAEEPTTEGERA